MPAVGLADLARCSRAAWPSPSSRWPTRASCHGPSRCAAAQRVDQDQELIALGGANLGAAFTPGFPISASTSRTPVAEAAGGRTQVTGVVGALAIVGLLVFVPGLTTHLPQPTLAAIVIVACISLVDVGGLRRLIRLRPSEAAPVDRVLRSASPFVGVVAGIFVAVGSGPRRVLLARLAPALGHPRAGRRDEGLPRHDPLSRTRAGWTAWSCSAGTRRCSSPTPRRSARRSRRRSPAPRARPLAGRRRRAGDRRRHERRGPARRASSRTSTTATSRCASPSSRTRSRTAYVASACWSGSATTRSSRPSVRGRCATCRGAYRRRVGRSRARPGRLADEPPTWRTGRSASSSA